MANGEHVVEPVWSLNRPAVQFRQTDAPELGANVSMLQLVHVVAAAVGAAAPAVQSTHVVLPFMLVYLPGEQLEQSVLLPGKGWNVPGTHT